MSAPGPHKPGEASLGTTSLGDFLADPENQRLAALGTATNDTGLTRTARQMATASMDHTGSGPQASESPVPVGDIEMMDLAEGPIFTSSNPTAPGAPQTVIPRTTAPPNFLIVARPSAGVEDLSSARNTLTDADGQVARDPTEFVAATSLASPPSTIFSNAMSASPSAPAPNIFTPSRGGGLIGSKWGPGGSLSEKASSKAQPTGIWSNSPVPSNRHFGMSSLSSALPSQGQPHQPGAPTLDKAQLAAEATRARMAEINQETSGNPLSLQYPHSRDRDRRSISGSSFPSSGPYRSYRDPDQAPSRSYELNYDNEQSDPEPEHLSVPAFGTYQPPPPKTGEDENARQYVRDMERRRVQRLIEYWVPRADKVFERLHELDLSSEDIEAVKKAIVEEKERAANDSMAVDDNDPLGLGLGEEFSPKKDGKTVSGENPSTGADLGLLD